MKKAEFETRYARLSERVRKLRETKGYDNDGIRCFLIGFVIAGGNYTSSQLRRIFDLGFTAKLIYKS